jgi:hypothetical protein
MSIWGDHVADRRSTPPHAGRRIYASIIPSPPVRCEVLHAPHGPLTRVYLDARRPPSVWSVTTHPSVRVDSASNCAERRIRHSSVLDGPSTAGTHSCDDVASDTSHTRLGLSLFGVRAPLELSRSIRTSLDRTASPGQRPTLSRGEGTSRTRRRAGLLRDTSAWCEPAVHTTAHIAAARS